MPEEKNMMTFPTTRTQLEGNYWTLQRRGFCRSCGRESEWWTTPSGRWQLLSVVPADPRVPGIVGAPTQLEEHNSICPQGKRWKAEGKVEEVNGLLLKRQ